MKAMNYQNGMFQDVWYGWFWNAFNIVFCGDILKHPGPEYMGGGGGFTKFDALSDIPIDYKVHNIKSAEDVILNDRAATLNALLDYENILYVVAVGTIEDRDRDYAESAKWVIPFKEMHGKKAKLGERSNVNMFRLKQIDFLLLNKDNLCLLEDFQTGFKNAGDKSSPRNPKYLLKEENYSKMVVDSIFGNNTRAVTLEW